MNIFALEQLMALSKTSQISFKLLGKGHQACNKRLQYTLLAKFHLKCTSYGLYLLGLASYS
jgi:hypothetical protein